MMIRCVRIVRCLPLWLDISFLALIVLQTATRIHIFSRELALEHFHMFGFLLTGLFSDRTICIFTRVRSSLRSVAY